MLTSLFARLHPVFALLACGYLWFHTFQQWNLLARPISGASPATPWTWPVVSTTLWLLLAGLGVWIWKRASSRPEHFPIPKHHIWMQLPADTRVKTALSLPTELFGVSTWVSIFGLLLQHEHLRLLTQQPALPDLVFWLLGGAIVLWPLLAFTRLSQSISKAARDKLRSTPFKPEFDQ